MHYSEDTAANFLLPLLLRLCPPTRLPLPVPEHNLFKNLMSCSQIPSEVKSNFCLCHSIEEK